MAETPIISLYPSDGLLVKDFRRVEGEFVENYFYLWSAGVDPFRFRAV
ncbi:MAG: hypothetical protein KME64_23555 [Scytonematopsis contorta HA4267-MV1]|jgi:hypothetical protein|nr:hypothetical protein [Scytonematopsis contorta HA4267-MV1]